MESESMTPALARAGRILLDWTMEEMAVQTRLSFVSIRDYESAARTPHRVTRDAIANTLARHGITFTGGEAVPRGLLVHRLEITLNPHGQPDLPPDAPNPHMTPALARAARALLGYDKKTMGDLCGLSAQAMTAYEKNKRKPRPITRDAIAAGYLEAGIEFLGGAGQKAGLVVHKQELHHRTSQFRNRASLTG